MAKPTGKTGEAVTTAADRSSKKPIARTASVTDQDIARRAYDLYLARDRQPGHELEDWLQAERELRSPRSTSMR
jgi:hypothetical protein